jgi:pimeloyl-ACP methyl ester carboxylesterase
VIVASGDGGWIHLGPHVAEVLASQGFFVLGFDVKAYLSGFTGSDRGVRVEDVPGDFAVLIDAAGRRRASRPVLIGVSEGAALCVVAAAHPDVKPRIAGVIGLGLGDINELAWRWKDAIIYLTKGVPHEPTFSSAAFIDKVTPVPLALVRATGDECVTSEESDRLAARARDPKRVWTVRASNHRFSDNLPEFDARLAEALQWMAAQQNGR